MAREFLEKTLHVENIKALRAKIEERIGGRLSDLESKVGWLFVGDNPPDLSEGVRVGSLWVDTTVPILKRATSISPVTFVSIEGGGGGGAPTDTEYLVAAAHAGLSAERVATDTPTVTWDFGTPGQAKATVPAGVVTPAAHAASHADGGSDEVSLDASQITTGTFPTARIGDDQVTNGKLADMPANTVKANPTAGAADPQDVAIPVNTVLGRKGGDIVAETIVTAQIADGQVSNAKFRASVATSVVGRAAGAPPSGFVADIVAGGNGHYLQRNSNTVLFDAIQAVDLPVHATQHETGGTDPLTGNLDANARITVRKNSGANVGTRRRLNLIEGANITLTVADDAAGEEVDVTVASSGGAGASWTTVEKDLGSLPALAGKFTLTDAAISPTSKVIILQAPGPYTGKGTRADECEMDWIQCHAVPASGSATVHWRSVQGFSGAQAGLGLRLNPLARVIGRVRGNVKFHYTIGA